MAGQLASLRSGASALLPIYPTTFEDVVRFARLTIHAGMIKPQKFGWGDEATIETNEAMEARATMILLQGMELGLPPMQSIQLLAMINGRITAHSEAVPGLLWSKGFKVDTTWSGTRMEDDWTATCSITRPSGEVISRTFSVLDAKQAGLWSPDAKITKKGKNNSTYQSDNDSPWHKYPQRMLPARALGFAGKDGAPDALKGLMVREEMEDMLRLRGELAHDITPRSSPSAPKATAKPTSVKPAAVSLPDIPDEVMDAEPDQTAEARLAIDTAISVEMLEHINEAYGEADWTALESAYAAKMDELKARVAA